MKENDNQFINNWYIQKTDWPSLMIEWFHMIYNLHQYLFSAIYKKYSDHSEKKTMETRIIKNISNKIKEDVGMSKP